MALLPGSKVGPYEIVAWIGSGGMGEVYRARDSALDRDVAIKVLPSSFSQDTERLRRFQQEAQATAALNDPNILTIYHIGEQDGSPYIVSELLEGQTLRQRLQAGAVPLRKAVDISVAVARGLAATHDRGIVHRDLKPENLFLTRDGRTKILDFGLAKLTNPEGALTSAESPTLATGSEPGLILGTVGYMSPEQVRAQPVGPTSDLFSLGAIMYEMFAGRRAFHANTVAETLSEILTNDPPSLSELNAQVPPGLERIVRHCLEKNSAERFQSARDLAFDLEALSATSGTVPVSALPASASKFKVPLVATLSLLALGMLVAPTLYFVLKSKQNVISYRRISFRQGWIQAARFAPDGQNVIYSASLEGKPPEVFSTRPQSPESRAMGLAGNSLLAVSPQGELAVLLQPRTMQIAISIGTLARVPLEGGVPRQILSNVENADWSPDGNTLLISRQQGGNGRLESPPGKLIYQNGGFIGHPRFSPRGDRIAFFDQLGPLDDSGSVAVVDLEGHKTVLSAGWIDLTGLAWSPDGAEVWFTGNRDGHSSALFAVTLKGTERQVCQNAGELVLFDIARDGRALLAREDWTSGIYGLAAGDKQERDLSWFDYSVASDLSRDGKNVLFVETGESSAPQFANYLRGMDGSPALRLSDGSCWALNPTGDKVLCSNADRQLIEVPTKTGEVKTLTNDSLLHGVANWLPDQKHLLFQGRESGHGFRLYVTDTVGGEPRPVTPEGANNYFRISPDGKQVAVAMGSEYQTQLYPVAGGDPRSIPSLEPGEVPIAWSTDGAFLFFQKLGEHPINIFRVDLRNGTRMHWKQTSPSDPVGITLAGQVYMSADLKSYVYTIDRRRDVLYLMNGLR